MLHFVYCHYSQSAYYVCQQSAEKMPPHTRKLNVDWLKCKIIQQALYLGQMHNQQFSNALCSVTSFFTCEEFASKAMEAVIPTGSLCVGDAGLSTDHNGSFF